MALPPRYVAELPFYRSSMAQSNGITCKSARLTSFLTLQLLAALLEHPPRQHHAASTPQTHETDVSSDTHDSPSEASTRVDLAQGGYVTWAYIQGHLHPPFNQRGHPAPNPAPPREASRSQTREIPVLRSDYVSPSLSAERVLPSVGRQEAREAISSRSGQSADLSAGNRSE